MLSLFLNRIEVTVGKKHSSIQYSERRNIQIPFFQRFMHTILETKIYKTRINNKKWLENFLCCLIIFVDINTFGKSPRDSISSLVIQGICLFAIQVLGLSRGSFVDRFSSYNVRNGMDPSIPMILRSSSSESE